jgi:hypothetical protein
VEDDLITEENFVEVANYFYAMADEFFGEEIVTYRFDPRDDNTAVVYLEIKSKKHKRKFIYYMNIIRSWPLTVLQPIKFYIRVDFQQILRIKRNTILRQREVCFPIIKNTKQNLISMINIFMIYAKNCIREYSKEPPKFDGRA